MRTLTQSTVGTLLGAPGARRPITIRAKPSLPAPHTRRLVLLALVLGAEVDALPQTEWRQTFRSGIEAERRDQHPQDQVSSVTESTTVIKSFTVTLPAGSHWHLRCKLQYI